MAVTVGGGGLLTASAARSDTASAVVPIVSCRLADTRPTGPLGADETRSFPVLGASGGCGIPADATAVTVILTVVDPTAQTYLTAFPTGTARPNTSNLDASAGDQPRSNQAVVALGTDGGIAIYNHQGSADIIIDINAYYLLPAATGPQGEPGEPGAAGDTGPEGPQGVPGISGVLYSW